MWTRRCFSELHDRMFHAQMVDSPESVTTMGLDGGEGSWATSQLDDRSEAAAERFARRHRAFLGELTAIDRARLTGIARINYDVVFLPVPGLDEPRGPVRLWCQGRLEALRAQPARRPRERATAGPVDLPIPLRQFRADAFAVSRGTPAAAPV